MADSGVFKIEGAAELSQMLKTYYSDNLKRAVVNTGLRKAGNKLRTYLRKAAPMGQTGNLKRSITTRLNKRTGEVKVGLSTRFYYKTLEFNTRKGAPKHPFVYETWKAHRKEIAQMIINETTIELNKRAGQIYARTLVRRKKNG